MSLRNYADIRRIGRHQSCPRLTAPSSIGIEPKPFQVTSSSSSSTRPLLLVTGTQIQRNDQPAVGATSTRRPATHNRRYSNNNIGLSTDVRFQLPRLNHASQNGICSPAPSVDDVVSSSSFTCKFATSVASSDCLVRRHQRFGTDDIDIQSGRPLFNQDRRCSLRRLDSASTLAEHEHLQSSFNVKNFAPKLKSSVKSKPAPIKRLSSFPELAPRVSCGAEERLSDQDAERSKISDAGNGSSTCQSPFKEEEPTFTKNEGCCKFEEKSRGADSEFQCFKLQDGYLKNDMKHVDKFRALKLQSVDGDVSEQMVKDKDESETILRQHDSSEEIIAMAMEKMSEEFHSVWPKLLRSLVEESLNDFENMDQHMKICMEELLSGDSESSVQ